jgi:hypothetical protein
MPIAQLPGQSRAVRPVRHVQIQDEQKVVSERVGLHDRHGILRGIIVPNLKLFR